MAFADAQTGFVLGDAYHRLPHSHVCYSYGFDHLMAKTTDGGATWHRVPAPPVSEPYGTMVFATPRIGIVLASHTWLTTDVSKTWHRTHLPGVGDDAVAADGRLWVIAKACSHHCPNGIFSAPLASPGRLRLDRSAPRFNGDGPYFVHGAGTEIYVNEDPHLKVGSLWRSPDGASWTRLRPPHEGCAIAAWSAYGLGAVCDQVLYGAGEEAKRSYVSYDGGATWIRRSDPSAFGYIDDLAAGSSTDWVLTDERTALETSIDGGLSWRGVTHFPRVALGDGVGAVQYLPPETFVAIPAYRSFRHLLISHDGGRNWTAITFPKWPYH